MIWRIRDRSGFQRLAREGRRTRAGALWCTYVLDPRIDPPQVAFAFGRAIGPAVTRNLLRRRLRAILHGMTLPDRPPQHPSIPGGLSLPAGWYLFGGSPDIAAQSFDELASATTRIVQRIGAPTPDPSSGSGRSQRPSGPTSGPTSSPGQR